MTSETTGTPKMIVPYEWILENVEVEPMTIASKMILFRGEKVFRVGLKNPIDKLSVLFFMTIDLNKIGMKVEDVMYGIQGGGLSPAIMEKMTQEDILGEGSLQLFTATLNGRVLGNCTFMFRIVIKGTYSLFYSYQLSDRLAKDQLWAALKSQQNLADVEFIVKNKKMSAHAAILAARSRMFAYEFEKKQPGKDGPHQIPIDGMDPSTVEKFLHFIYTGEPMGTLADEELLQLAEHYRLTTLINLCQVALSKIETTQMTKFMASLHSGVDALSSSRIMPEKETEIFFDRTTPTFRCAWRFYGNKNGESKCVMQYQKENIFFAYFTGHSNYENRIVSKFAVHFSCDKYRRFGLQIEDIYFNLDETCKINPANGRKWLKLEETRFKKQTEILHFTVSKLRTDVYDTKGYKSNFDIKTVCTIGNYYYEMMDNAWLTDLWTAATKKTFTDVKIFVGTVEVMEAHRVILCARSPVLNADLNKISNTEKSIVTFEAEFEVEIVENFLNFLYTGSLKSTDNVQQLSQLATMYEVETLKNVCQPFQLINANPPDVEGVTDYLLQL